MNKPAEPAAVMAQLEIDHLPLSAIAASPTNPRKTFDKAYLNELAASIKAMGVIQPIVVRPAKPGATDRFELVVGECRWRASKIAGRAHIPALIRSLTDVEVLELQITENLQRNDLQPLEEADGYHKLIELRRGQGETLLAEQLAEKIGKSRSYVYQRIKLLELGAAGRKALAEGTLDVSRALLIARIPGDDLQKKALEAIEGSDWDGPMSYREAQERIQEDFMLKLADAPFDPKDAGLVEKAGACTTCPKRTGNAPDLFGDVKGKNVCTDPVCFQEKKQAVAERALKDLEAKGKTVIKGEDAAAIVRAGYYEEDSVRVGGGYVSLDDTCRDDPKNRKVRDVVGTKHADKVEFVQGPKGAGLVQVIKTSTLKEILNEKGVKTEGQKRAAQAKKTRAANEKAELEERIVQGVLAGIHAKHPGKATREDLLLIANALADSFDNAGGYNYGRDGGDAEARIEAALDCNAGDPRKVIKGMKEADLVRFCLVMSLILLDTTPEIRATAKRLKVDEAKIRKEVIKAATAPDDDEPEEGTENNGKKK